MLFYDLINSTGLTNKPINESKISFDGTTYTLVKEKNNGGEDNIGYYTNLSNTLKSVAKLLVNNSKTTTIADFIKRYDEIMTKLSNKFDI